MALAAPTPSRFGLFEFDASSQELRRRGLRVRLTPQCGKLLGMLLEEPVRTRTRDEIQRRLWSGNIHVDFERSMNKVVHALREALGESARNPRFIETVSAEGYRFLPPPLFHQTPARHPVAPGVIERMAVLPLRTEKDPEVRAMARLLPWLLTLRLADVPGLRVLAGSQLISHKLEVADPRQAGEALGVDAVLCGELIAQQDRLILQCELIDAEDGALLGGAMIERDWQRGVRCEKELAWEVFRRIRPLVHTAASQPRPPQQVVVLERYEGVS